MSNENHLIAQFGLLMNMEDLATLLGRSRQSLRSSLHTNAEFAGIFRPAMIKVGRRIYFRTAEVAIALKLTQVAD